jgi:hypothetical protein
MPNASSTIPKAFVVQTTSRVPPATDRKVKRSGYGNRVSSGLGGPHSRQRNHGCYTRCMATSREWVLLAYHLPREPSTPRIALWRKLRRLGAGQVQDGLVALPLLSKNREQFEWLADEVLDAGGEASVWLAQSLSLSQERQLIDRMTQAIAEEYRTLMTQAQHARTVTQAGRRQTLTRLRRELRRIGDRDYFPPPERQEALDVVQTLAAGTEVSS